MGPFDRGLLLLYTLTFTIVLAVFFLMFAGWQPALDLAEAAFAPERREVLLAVAGALFLAGLKLMAASVRAPRREDKLAVVEDAPLGEVSVSLSAVESLVSRVVGNFPGIREVRPRVVSRPQGIMVRIKVVTAPSINIPAVSQEIQNEVAKAVREVTGLNVNNVQVQVEDISTVKARVE
ncbi:MAG: alkaline shock response membrane anchor protein AmaP [Bacillota bacterium]